MKTKYTLPIAFAFLLFCSCSWEHAEPVGPAVDPLQSRGLMQVEIAENSGQGTDKIKTIRFIVFNDLTTTPKKELNEFYSEDDFTIEEPENEKAASKVKIILEVLQKASGSNQKLVVAIVNEPDILKAKLNAINTLAQLENLELELAQILNGDHLSLKTDVPMPMSGAIWVNEFYSTEEEAALEQNTLKLGVSRFLARVDVYLLNGDNSAAIPVAAGSTVTLSNTYTKSWFVRHEDEEHTLGRIQTVTAPLTNKTWTAEAALAVPARGNVPTANDSLHVCSFYTPERFCTAADKLKIDISAIIPDEGTRSGGITLDKADDKDGISRPITVIRRNSIYRVTATIWLSEITGEVQGWNSEKTIYQEL